MNTNSHVTYLVAYVPDGVFTQLPSPLQNTIVNAEKSGFELLVEASDSATQKLCKGIQWTTVATTKQPVYA